MKFGVIAVALLLAPVTVASAADVAYPAPTPAPPAYRPPPLPPAYNWSGFYLGAMGGYGMSNSQGVDFKGGFAGGTLGYNVQMQNLVVGVEVEGAWSDIGQSASTFFGLVTATDRIQAFGSATTRIGFAVDNLLIYGKGGYTAASNKITLAGAGGSVSDSEVHNGYTVGGGIEVGFAPNWSIKGEYLFSHYFSENYFASVIPPGAASGDFDVHTGKIGINYRFGGPIVARY